MTYTLELYTRPTCSDCQDSKQYLKEQGIPFTEYDLSQVSMKEEELKKVTGTRVVPGFVFREHSLLSKFKKPTVFTGFELNKAEIKKMAAQVRK